MKGFMKYGILGAGAAALVMRSVLYDTAVDATGRLTAGHPLSWALLALTLAAAALAFAAARQDSQEEGRGIMAALGHWVLALGILAAVTNYVPPMTGIPVLVWRVLGWLSFPCLMTAGGQLAKKQPVAFVLHMVPTAFLTVHMINHYQLWCSNPQFQDVAFPLFATVALTVLSYQQTASAVQMGSRRQLALARYAAVYLCLAELAADTCFPLYAAGALYAASGLFSRQEV